MPVTHAELWKLLQDSRLIPATRAAEVEAAFAQARMSPDVLDVRSMTAWLVREQLLTRYQAEQLLRGRGGPFFYGPYRVIDRVRDGRLRGLFRAIHEPTHFAVLLRFAAPRVAQDPRLWNHVRQYQRGHTALDHPHLQRVYSLEDTSGHRFLVLEDLAGDALAESLEPGSALRPADACSVIHMTALGLAALHEQRHTHGDVRPANLWLDPAGHLKLLRDFVQPPVIPDFTRADLSEFAAQQVDYLAPELAHPGTRLNPATDIYALGCTFFELLSGEPPFAGTPLSETLERHAQEPIASLEPLGVPPELAELVTHMLVKNPLERMSSARQVAERIAPFLDPPVATIQAPPATSNHLSAFEAALGRTGWSPPAPPPIITNLPPPPPPVTPTLPMEPPAVETPRLPDEPDRATKPETANAPAFELDGTTEQSVTARRTRRRKSSPRQRALTLGALAIVAVLLATSYVLRIPAPFWQLVLGATPNSGPTSREPNDTAPTDSTPVPQDDASPSAPQWTGLYQPAGDDGQTLWMPPSDGQPISIAGVPSGAQMLLHVRAAELAKTTAGQLLLRSVGDELATFRPQWEATAGCSWNDIQSLTVCWNGEVQSLAEPTFVVHLLQPLSRDRWPSIWGQPTEEGEQGAALFHTPATWICIPPAAGDAMFVMGSESTLREILGQAGQRAVLRREMAQLLAASNDQNLVTLLVVPSFLHDLLAHSSATPLQRAVPATDWLLGEDFTACQVSFSVGETGYLELRGCGRTGADSLQLAESLRQRMRELPTRIEEHFQNVYPDPYWRPIALRMPEMVRFLADYTRVGIEDEQAIVNSVLPPQAVHNLLFASQMLMAAGSEVTGPNRTSTAPTANQPVPQTIDALLSSKMSFQFAAQSLEFAIRDLAEAVREKYPQLPVPFDIQILGSDLQLQGITRNQQIAGFEAVDQPLAEILTALVMRANPVTTVTTPSDPNQKLVWIQGPDPADANRPILLITTRDAAQRRNDTLPAAFQPN